MITGVDFIDFLIKNKTIQEYDAKSAYTLYSTDKSNIPFSSYAYFRTKFNNKFKSLNSIIVEESREIIVEEVPEILFIEQGRVVKNYKTGDVPPDPPGLMPTGTLFDEIVSDRITTDQEMQDHLDKYGEEFPEEDIEIGGFTRKCVDITAGKAGSGKTYSRAILAAMAKIFAKREYNKDLRIGFISGEMRESEWAKEISKCELLKEIEVDYMLNYVGQSNYEEIFWEAIGDYDIVVVDSFPAILGHIRMTPNEKRTEKTIINDFIRTILQSVEANDNNVQLINQCNKDGNYKGGTELPHMLSSLSMVNVEGRSRYLIYEKNRNNGNVNQKVYFSKSGNGLIEFNEEAYNATYKQAEDQKTSMQDLLSGLHAQQNSSDETESQEDSLIEEIAAIGDIGDTSTGYLATREI